MSGRYGGLQGLLSILEKPTSAGNLVGEYFIFFNWGVLGKTLTSVDKFISRDSSKNWKSKGQS